eukprot:TRINITY_DN4058_c0_g2_i1.p1 TRINITY_DN4058_c0_g2~~TRINITY_DN4058_c0_g2_i1.p1  ORF type:complete len:893 (-),score=127.36 TRINITY_DN4058_c0_g2_i1:297-2975(-)
MFRSKFFTPRHVARAFGRNNRDCTEKKRSDYVPPNFAIPKTSLEIALDAHSTSVKAHLNVVPKAQNLPSLDLDGDAELVDVFLNGRKLVTGEDYTLVGQSLRVLKIPAEPFELTISTKVSPLANKRLSGLYCSNGILCTQCEAEGFRHITYFLDRPDIMSTYSTTLIADAANYPVLLSNGNLGKSITSLGKHQVTWDDPFPKPSYLFALVAGALDVKSDTFVTSSGKTVRLNVFCERGKAHRCEHAIAALQKAMKWDEDRFGLEYDLSEYNIVAVPDFNMGAMENKSLNVFNDKYILADPTTATDGDFQAIEAVVAHEYFHNWTGNRVTLRDWFQLSLKEGLTVFRDQEFTSDQWSRAVKRIQDVQIMRAVQFREDAGPLAHPVRPDSYIEMNNFYTTTVYNKGAEVVRMIHTILGEARFQAGMRLYIQRHDGQAVTCDDFVQAMEDATGTSLAQFRHWYSQAGTPTVNVTSEYNAAEKTFALHVTQSTPATPGQAQKVPLHIPIKLSLLDSKSGHPIALNFDGNRTGTETVLSLTQDKQSFVFTDVANRPVASLFRDWSAPIRSHIQESEEDVIFRMLHDDNSFNRWEAFQQLCLGTLRGLYGNFVSLTQPAELPSPVFQAFERNIALPGLDAAFRALLLSPPSQAYLFDQIPGEVDVDCIQAAHLHLRSEIARRLHEQWQALYVSNAPATKAYSLDAQSVGARALRATALHYLVLVGNEAVAYQHGQDATNMTDTLAALNALAQSDSELFHTLLHELEIKWLGDPLLMDKWFAVQALSPIPGRLHVIQQLLTHPAFTITRPNSVYNLLGAWTSNPQFHSADGAGYALLAEQILHIDSFNPQVAARLARAFQTWKRHTVARQQLITDRLRWLSGSNLSRDTFEIVQRALSS